MFFSLITKKLRQQILESIIVQETYQEIAERVTDAMLNRSIAKINKRYLYYVSIIPDRYCSVPIFISDRPSVSIGTYFFRHDFRNGEGLERSDSESDTRRIG